ncbi:MAG: hypothetical protein KIH62_001310 [Candidatus Kerfeldbacteria bacterium]|nr:hypothetical protein [Candidatus Kerfeldbacteria bacterium]
MNFSLHSLISALNLWIARYYYWCAATVCIICVLLGWFLFLQPQYQKIQGAGLVDLQTANAELVKRQTQLADLDMMQKSYESLNAEQLRQLHSVLPTDVDEISLLASLQAFADASRATILSIDVVLSGNAAQVAQQTQQQNANEATTSQPIVSNEHVRIAYITLNIRPLDSTYEGFKQFLASLDHFTPVLNLQQMTYSPTTTSYALQLETYYAE